MNWRVRPLGCLVAAVIFAIFGAGILGFLVCGPDIGNRGGPLTASDVRALGGMRDVPDRRTGGSFDPVPTWRVDGEARVSFSVTLRNGDDAPVRVTGVRRDEDGDDQQFVPERVDPVTLGPGEARSVTVEGRAVCEDKYGGQISGKNGQTFAYDEGETQNVDFDALIEFVACR